jgi:hypothetical protein
MGDCAALAPLDAPVVICTASEERWQNLVDAAESVRARSLPPREILLVVAYNPRLVKRAATAGCLALIENGEEARRLEREDRIAR